MKTIDLKIIEYTKNAISNNETEVVKENIGLLTECQNYYTFLNLLEELFDWDEKYACKTLNELSKKNRAWIVKEKMNFFKKYALNKLITQSGKLDAIQNLLLIYDPSNLGMSKLEPQINDILDRQHELREKEDEQLSNELLSILQNASTKDFRMYYLPIRETCTAYDEGKYEIVNKYLTVILENYHQELRYIRIRSGITNIGRPMEFTFSYVTEEDKLPMIRLHDLRHTSATLLISAKEDIETISHRLGHSKASVTMDVYGHWMKETDEKAADTMGRLFTSNQ